MPEFNSFEVKSGSALIRNDWLVADLIKQVANDPFQNVMGSSWESVIYSRQQPATSGLTTKFDFDGFLVGRSVLDKEGARGKGEKLRGFSDSLSVKRQRYVVSNGDPLDAINIGRTPEERMRRASQLLAKVWQVGRSQNFMDCMQGTLNGATPSHVIRPNSRAAAANIVSGDTFDLGVLDDIVMALKEGTGFETGSDRMPYLPYTMRNGKPKWLVYLDPIDMNNLRKDADFRDAVTVADTQGMENLFFSSRAFEYQDLIISEMPRFVGSTSGNNGDGSTLRAGEIIQPGARLFDGASTVKYTRSLVLGAGAMLYGKGIAPFASSEESDFGAESESAMTIHHNMKKTRLTPEGADYTPALKDIDFGVLTIECYARG